MDLSSRFIKAWVFSHQSLGKLYDGRGHLFDLTAHDAEYVAKRPWQMSEHEEAVEKACEEERYLELHTDLQEEAMYEEEEWKRYYLALQEGYKAVGFSYDQPEGEGEMTTQQTPEDEVEQEKPFVVPEELQVPKDMQVPLSQKEHARIEKTANFISKQGIQMEIMIKTKQSGNPQFNYLHFENELNPFYKHVVHMMKTGRYKYNPAQENVSNDEDKEEGSYLHPSLASVTQLPPPPPAPLKPIELPKVSIHDTPYGALIQSIKRNNPTTYVTQTNEKESVVQSTIPIATTTDVHYSAPTAEEANVSQVDTQPNAFNGTSLVERLYGPLPAEDSPSDRPSRKKKRRRKRSETSDSSSSSSSSSSERSSRKSRRKKTSPPPCRAEGPPPIAQPSPDVQPIVDRMALYVAKNGLEFEIVVKGRNDPRFQFLNEYHALFPYYSMKREMFIKELGPVLHDSGKKDEKNKKEDESSQGGPRSVSFSIKAKPKESESTPSSGKPSLFENDTSEDEDKEQQTGSESVSRSATPPIKAIGNDETLKPSGVSVEEKLKDKLASALKERISQSSKEKVLQLERKKKAAMFLTMIKTNQPDEPILPPNVSASLSLEDSSSLYVGESASSDTHHSRKRSRSPKERHRRRKSPTPPSAYSRRSPSHPGSSLRGFGDAWSSSRERDKDIARQRWPRASKSPGRREEKKKKKHKQRSRSRSPHSTERSKSSKHKSKDKDREKKKSRRNRDKEGKKRSKHKDGDSGSSSDLEVIEELTSSKLSSKESSHHVDNNGHQNLDEASKNIISRIPETIQETSEDAKSSKMFGDVQRENLSFSLSNSPSASNLEAKESSSHSQSGQLAPSSDFMSKVRAMLKKSREISKEESFGLEDT